MIQPSAENELAIGEEPDIGIEMMVDTAASVTTIASSVSESKRTSLMPASTTMMRSLLREELRGATNVRTRLLEVIHEGEIQGVVAIRALQARSSFRSVEIEPVED